MLKIAVAIAVSACQYVVAFNTARPAELTASAERIWELADEGYLVEARDCTNQVVRIYPDGANGIAAQPPFRPAA